MRRRPPKNVFAGLAVAALVASTLAVTGGAASAQPSADPAAAAADAYVASDRASLHKSAGDALVRVTDDRGTHGLRFFGYERTYRGLPVIGGDLVVMTTADGTVVDATVNQRQVIDIATRPVVSPAQATVTARGELAEVTSQQQPELAVLAWDDPALVWRVALTGTQADGTPSVRSVYVDALTGEVAGADDLVVHGTGNGFYNGTVTIDTSPSGGGFAMIDPIRPNTRCTNQNGTTFTGSDDLWGNGSGTNLETACVDALYGVQQQWDMLDDWLGRDGINGNGGGFPARVGLTIVNAFWNGSSANFGRTSDGQRQITPMDVVAHEFGHGIFQTTPGGSGSGGTGNEKGGLNEGTGDIFGALTEAYADNPNDPADYLVGEEADLVGNGPIRNMANPGALGHPNCWSSAIPNTEVHEGAGPLNHWFYLVAEGNDPPGGPSSPICPGGPSGVDGIGIVAAGQVFYNALLQKTTSWRYVNVRRASMNAVVSMFGAGSPECVTVRDAWDAVSVPSQAGEPTCGGGTPPPPPPPPGGTIYQDSFETSTGWTLSGNASTGIFERGVPQATSSGGVQLQVGSVPHGSLVAVTGAAAGAGAGSFDVDGGVTTITSPSISLPSTGDVDLLYEWTFAHLNNATSADFFRVSVISGGSTTIVHNVAGSASNRSGSWSSANVNLDGFRGQSIQLRVEVADNGSASLIEGAIDNVRITQS